MPSRPHANGEEQASDPARITTTSGDRRRGVRPTVTWGINPGSPCTWTNCCQARRRGRIDRAAIGEALDFMGSRRDPAFAAPGSTSRSSARARTPDCPICAKPRGSSATACAPPSGACRSGSHASGRRPSAKDSIASHRRRIRLARRRLFDVFAMNPDKLEGREICASSSNRNFKGRQGSPTGRTLLMSPAMVAAAAVAGEVVDIRELADGD